MIGTYAAVLAICAASLAIGQAAIALCGARRWSWPAPAVGLALVCAVCWGTVRVVSALAVLVLKVAAVVYLRGRVEGAGEAFAAGWPVALGALLATALPFIAEGHFGILGTSFNPDMSQHLLAADRLAEGNSSQLLVQGYPLGPHAIVVALNKGLGIGLVQGFTGLTIAVAVLASLTALAAFRDLPAIPRTAGALLVGLAYLVASYFAQGAFKETMQALYLLAFVLALREAESEWTSPLRFVPAAVIAVGSVYTYSFPGLIWLGGVAVLWAIFRRPPLRPLGLALLAFFVLIAPEIGRLIDFKQFETFDPNGPGLGNLFGQVSPFEALGIWPSGDFRLAPGDGAVPAIGYYLGIAFALALFAYGLAWLWRRRETAILSGLAAAALAYAAARTIGTPYTAAKAIEIGAPLVALAIVLPIAKTQRLVGALFVLAAGVCSLLALANAPVGPTSYSSTLSEYRRLVGEGPTLVLASPQLLEEEHGEPFLAWELRGGRVCIKSTDDPSVPPGVRFVVRDEGGWTLTRVKNPTPGQSPCPLIAVRQARQGPAR